MPRHCPWSRPKVCATTASAEYAVGLDAGWDAGVDAMGVCARLVSYQDHDFKPATLAARLHCAPARVHVLTREGLNRLGV